MYQKNIWVMFAFVTVHNYNLEIMIKDKIMSSECENRLGYEDMNPVFVAGLLVINKRLIYHKWLSKAKNAHHLFFIK